MDIGKLRVIILVMTGIYSNPDTPLTKKQELRRVILTLLLIYRRTPKNKRKLWVRPIFTVEQRLLQGDSHNLVKLLENTDPTMYFI